MLSFTLLQTRLACCQSPTAAQYPKYCQCFIIINSPLLYAALTPSNLLCSNLPAFYHPQCVKQKDTALNNKKEVQSQHNNLNLRGRYSS